MGRGDRKTRKGKIWRGSYGNTRPKKTSNAKNRKPVLKLVPKEETAKVAVETSKSEKPARKKAVAKKAKKE